MPNRLSDVPPMATARMTMPAVRYARARRAVREAGAALRADIPGLRGLDVLIEERVWLCVDRTLDDLPVLAWLDFDPPPERGLRDPVPCRVQFYHFHAQAIMDTVLASLDSLVESRLEGSLPRRAGEVRPFPPPRKDG